MRVYESGGRVRAVYGIPMTQGATPKQAAAAWLSEYSTAFCQPKPVLVEYSTVTSKSGKTVVTYKQVIDGLKVEGAACTVVVAPLPGPKVVYAASRLGDRPAGGLAAFTLSGAQAIAAAQAHPAGAQMNAWEVPQQVAILDEEQNGIARARSVWKCRARGPGPAWSLTFYVDAASGQVVRYGSNVFNFDITGTVQGRRTPGLAPDTWECTGNCGPPYGGTLGCENHPTTVDALAGLKVLARDPGTQAVLASAFTNSVGQFTLALGPGPNVNVEAALVGPHWQIFAGCVRLCTSFGGPATVEVFPNLPRDHVFPQPIQFNHESNPPFPQPPPPESEEFRTADVNTFWHLEDTWRYFQDRLCQTCDEHVPGLHDMVSACTNVPDVPYNAYAFPEIHRLQFARARGCVFAQYCQTCQPPCSCNLPVLMLRRGPNMGHSMIVSHEYGHYLLWWMRGLEVPAEPQHNAFHEGFADSVAHLVHDWEIEGVNYFGCPNCPPATCFNGPHSRDPVADNPQYPDCTSAGAHDHGMLLSVIWIKILREIREVLGHSPGLEATRQLHVNWSLLTNGGVTSGVCVPPPPMEFGRSAHWQTMLEVLIADDDDGDFGNGTPHRTQICAAFAAHDILCDGDSAGAPGSAVACRADCDGDGVLRSLDFECYVCLWRARDARADCTRDDTIDMEDWSCFHRHFAVGCP